MEYCSHGTIEEAAKQGLPEVVIRRYTKDLLTAIDFLHEHNVVHRDIKGCSSHALFATYLHTAFCVLRLCRDLVEPSTGEGWPI